MGPPVSRERQQCRSPPLSLLGYFIGSHQRREEKTACFFNVESDIEIQTECKRKMGTEGRGVPAIDIGELKMDGSGELGRLREASERWGCFRVVNHEIPVELMAEMKAAVRSLLDLPTEIKKKNTDVIAGSGYMAPTEKNPLYEALGLYNMGSPQSVHHFCSQLNASSHQRSFLKS